jgi:undecaprenyl-diphosphatase
MTLFEALLLGLVQGITEFLPVSSDGHLALATMLLGKDPAGDSGIVFDLVVHLATMLAVCIRFRRELWELRAALVPGEGGILARRVVLLVFAASVPTAIVGLLIKDTAEWAFGVPVLVGLGFLGTSFGLGVSLLLLRRRPGRPAEEPVPGRAWADLESIRVRDAVAVGIAQGLAPWPGLSRSASTIAAAVACGVRPGTAARFSLLASLPAIGGAFLLKIHEAGGHAGPLPPLLLGFLVAGVVGYFAIGWLISIARSARLGWFALYTLLLGLFVLAFSLSR